MFEQVNLSNLKTFNRLLIKQKIFFAQKKKCATFAHRFGKDCIIKWSHRLAVRTSGFHPGNRGSIPLGTTEFIRTLIE
jgi:hypothetical protein